MSLKFFQKFSIWFKSLLQELLYNFISVILLLVFYGILWHFPQATDLLLILNQSDSFLMEVPLYFVLLFILAALIWITPKYLYYENYSAINFRNLLSFVPHRHYKANKELKVSYRSSVKQHMRKVVPRLLGVLLLFISAIGILNAMEIFQLENTYTRYLNPGNTLLYIILGSLVFTEPRWYSVIKSSLIALPKKEYFVLLMLVLLLVVIISLGTLNTRAEKDLGNLFISNTALAILFLVMIFNKRIFLFRYSLKFFHTIILISGALLWLCFLILNIVPNLASYVNPLSIILIALTSFFFVSFLLLLLGKKIRIPLFSLTVILCLLLAKGFSQYKGFTHFELPKTMTSVDRLPMEQYMYHWIKQRKDEIACYPGKFPVIFVSSEGGGSRAGLWAFLVHSYLYEKTNGTYYNTHLLSLTGASGGSVGNSMFFAQSHSGAINGVGFKNTKPDDRVFDYKASTIYQTNYLSSALLTLIGRDFFKSITNLFTFDDRGQLLEKQWSKAFGKVFSNDKTITTSLLDEDFLSFFDIEERVKQKKKLPPLLLVNTTHVQSGKYHTVSPVDFSHLQAFAGIADFFDKLQQGDKTTSIALSTAMRINASFPYITPVGEVRNTNETGLYTIDQYADAGYYDNLGGTITLGVSDVFDKIMATHYPELRAEIKKINLIIANEPDGSLGVSQTQLFAPAVTLANIRSGHTQEVFKKLGSSHIIELRRKAIPPLEVLRKGKKITQSDTLLKPILPLGRYLSEIAIHSMEARLREVQSQLDAILGNCE